MYGKRPTRQPSPPRRSAVHEMLSAGEGFDDRPFGGYAGEILPRPEVAAALPPPQPLPIEPPPWQAELEAGDLAELAPLPEPAPTDGLTAVERLKLDAGDVPELLPPGPPMVMQPLIRPRLPEPERAEEREAKLMREIAKEGT